MSVSYKGSTAVSKIVCQPSNRWTGAIGEKIIQIINKIGSYELFILWLFILTNPDPSLYQKEGIRPILLPNDPSCYKNEKD